MGRSRRKVRAKRNQRTNGLSPRKKSILESWKKDAKKEKSAWDKTFPPLPKGDAGPTPDKFTSSVKIPFMMPQFDEDADCGFHIDWKRPQDTITLNAVGGMKWKMKAGQTVWINPCIECSKVFATDEKDKEIAICPGC